jgi:hypothetical protein
MFCRSKHDKNTATEAINYLKEQCVHPFINPFNDIPMGHQSNNVFLSPADPFHTYCAGMIKYVVTWTLGNNFLD